MNESLLRASVGHAASHRLARDYHGFIMSTVLLALIIWPQIQTNRRPLISIAWTLSPILWQADNPMAIISLLLCVMLVGGTLSLEQNVAMKIIYTVHYGLSHKWLYGVKHWNWFWTQQDVATEVNSSNLCHKCIDEFSAEVITSQYT